MPNKVKEGYSLTQIYKYYKEKQQEKKEVVLSERQYKDIVFLYNKKIAKYVLDGGVFKFPFGLSTLRIKKTQFDDVTPSLNYAVYNKTGKKIYFLNEHSDGFRAKWLWNRRDIWIQGKGVFHFVPSWTNKRALAKSMKEHDGHKKYME